MMPYRNIPVVQVTIRSPLGVLYMVPLFPFVLSIFIVSIVFLIWPEALSHSPIGFETRGVIHHFWHAFLAIGSLAALWGMFAPSPARIPMEAAGLILLIGCIGMNLAVVVEQFFREGGDVPGGLDLILRIGLLITFAIRTYVLIAQPTIVIPRTPPNGD